MEEKIIITKSFAKYACNMYVILIPLYKKKKVFYFGTLNTPSPHD